MRSPRVGTPDLGLNPYRVAGNSERIIAVHGVSITIRCGLSFSTVYTFKDILNIRPAPVSFLNRAQRSQRYSILLSFDATNNLTGKKAGGRDASVFLRQGEKSKAKNGGNLA